MNFSLRSLGLAMLLLLLFLGAALTLQWWLARETRQLRQLAVSEQRERFGRTAALMVTSPAVWDEAVLREFGAVLGGTVELLSPGATETNSRSSMAAELSFSTPIPQAPEWKARVRFAAPALLRLQILHQRTLAAIVLLSLLVAITPLLHVLLSYRRSAVPDGASRTPWANTRAQAAGYEQLARISHERTAALALEHDARLRAEEDLDVNRTLLDESVAERVRLGRELHDNICQTLYAVCLTLESVQNKNTLAPELKSRMDRSMTELRRLNQEVRAYLQGLEPAQLSAQSFLSGAARMLTTFGTENGLTFEQKFDEDALALIPAQQTAEVLNILREAVSNGIRHGRAKNITLLAARNEHEIVLAVQDDGIGFAKDARSSGHGLNNMKARAAALGGELRVESTSGKGTRVLLTLPVPSPV